MNFTTDLPKRSPKVTYIVASAVRSEKFFPDCKNEGPSFRMHAVILAKPDRLPAEDNYILCHLRKIDKVYKGTFNKPKRKTVPKIPERLRKKNLVVMNSLTTFGQSDR